MANVYKHFLENPDLEDGNYNAGFENISILDIANLSKKTNAEIIVSESNDPRSYRQDSTKLLNSGFRPKYGVEDAIDEIINFENKLEDKKTFIPLNG